MADDLAGKRAVTSFARIPHDAVPAIREAIRDPLLVIPAGPVDVAVLKARTADAWHVWHQSTRHRTDVGRLLPRLVTDAWIAARAAEGQDRRAVHAVLADVHALGVEIARAYHQRHDYPAMLHWLEQAYQTSADSVRYSPTPGG